MKNEQLATNDYISQQLRREGISVHVIAPPTNTPNSIPAPEDRPLDKVKLPTDKKRSRELER